MRRMVPRAEAPVEWHCPKALGARAFDASQPARATPASSVL